MPESTLASPDTDARDDVVTFVNHLHGLYTRRKRDGSARASLAELRRSSADSTYRWSAMRIVGASMPDGIREEAAEAYLLTAELFGIYAGGGTDMPDASRLPKYRQTLGASARLVNGRKKNNEGGIIDENEGITRRFQALLALPAEDLPDELRRFLRLLRSKDAPVDFYQLLRDLLAWDNRDRSVQRRWARDYWPPFESSSDDSSSTNA